MFNKETEYALRGLVYIQKQNNRSKTPGIDEISREIDAPRAYTAKVLQRLVRTGYLDSAKGKGGGFFFGKGKADLSLMKLVTVIEGDKTFAGCVFGLRSCDCENPCPMHDRYSKIRNELSTLLVTETIQSLALKGQKKVKKSLKK